jgi:hypothetical protein
MPTKRIHESGPAVVFHLRVPAHHLATAKRLRERLRRMIAREYEKAEAAGTLRGGGS